MTPLSRLISARNKHQCDLCAVSLCLNAIQFGLILALHMGDA